MDCRRDRAARRRRTTLYVESRHRKRSHAPTRALTRRCMDGKLPEEGGTCVAVCRQGCHQRVDRPSAPRNLWFPTGEELPGKSPAVVTVAAAAARRRADSGEGEHPNDYHMVTVVID